MLKLKQKPKTQPKKHESRFCLYVGTTEQMAKEAPLKGIEPPAVLSDVYPGYFAFSALTTPHQKIGIIEIALEALMPGSLVPFHGYIEKLTRKRRQDILLRRQNCLLNIESYKKKWQESLRSCGVCLYLLQIPPAAINKITIYSPMGGNKFVNQRLTAVDPWELTKIQHTSKYETNLSLTKWLTCDFAIGKPTALTEELQNRSGLELYYRRTEAFHTWWKT